MMTKEEAFSNPPNPTGANLAPDDPEALSKAAIEGQREALRLALQVFTPRVVERFLQPRNMGVLKRPDGYGRVIGECGDSVEVTLRLRGDIVAEIRFLANGCGTTQACGSMATELATGRPLRELFSLNALDVLDALGGLPEENEHCALLAVNALHEAAKDALRTRNEPWKRLYR